MPLTMTLKLSTIPGAVPLGMCTCNAKVDTPSWFVMMGGGVEVVADADVCLGKAAV